MTPRQWPVDEFALAVLDGLEAAGVAVLADMDRADLVDHTRHAEGLGWTPLMLGRWVEHHGWPATTTTADVAAALFELGRPPERPRSGEPLRSDVCPEHGVELLVGGRCPVCTTESKSVDHAGHAAAIRARHRAATEPRGLPLTGAPSGRRAASDGGAS